MRLISELRRRNVLRMAVLYSVTAWLIMQVAEVIMGLATLPEWIGQALLGILAIGFPIALIFAWVYEITPEGVKLESEVDRSDSITHLTGRRMDFVVIAMLSAAVILFAYEKWWRSADRDMLLPPSNSIAVLAFANMSPDPEQEFLSDGIAEELLNMLAQMQELKVIARTSSFSFKGAKADIATVAEKLNVRHVVEGSVRRSGDRVRITAQLIDTTDSTQIWSQTYDRKLTDIFAVQDEISAAVVGALKEHLGLQIGAVPQVIGAADTEAYEAYLRGRHLLVQRTRDTMEGAVREFEKAIEIDPNHARAHAELAIAMLFSNRGYLGDIPLSDAISRAAPHARQALALDPDLAEAHAATGQLWFLQQNPEEALAHFEKAIQINPNYAIVYNWIAIVPLKDLGRYTESIGALETALRLDPLSISTRSNYAVQLISRNRLAEADGELEKLASIAPDWFMRMRAMRMSVGGKWANAVLGSLDSLRNGENSERSRTVLASQLAVIDLEKEALAVKGASHFGVLRIMGRPEDAVTTVEARLAGGVDVRVRHDLALALAGSGDYASARPILEERWQRSGGRITCCSQFRIDSAAALIAIRHDAGEDAEAGELLAAIRDNVRRYRQAGMVGNILVFSVDFEEGLAAFLAGEREKGLALIAKVTEDGYFILPGEAYLQTLYDDPVFVPILARQEARQAREQERFLTVVCTDNPYSTVWQPAKGTCEQFAAAGGI